MTAPADPAALEMLGKEVRLASLHYRRAMRARVNSNERRKQMLVFDGSMRACFVIGRTLGMDLDEFIAFVHQLEPALVAKARLQGET